ncbi:EamA-like transporter family protein [Jannaschia faecimaris]|uniref:EamA-like transporter family protein n=1 Tax=Jannaschia faecimaris TaxID=1244108 RepID=A0A1H3NR17_9RHOB|nr:DMT family transporter [Jannaschia faecimaris]SDY91203.1 EamA-like transporter family protein [Jannaschia faecimaris]
MDQFIRIIAAESSLWTFHIVRSGMMWVLALVFVAVMGRRLKVVNLRAVAARSAVMSTAMILYFGALGFMSVAEAAAGLFSAPIWVLIFSVVFFGLRIGPVRVAAAIVGFVGVILVLSPDMAALSVLNLLPVLSGAFYAVAVIATREWCDGEDAITLALGVFSFMAFWGLCGIALGAALGWEPTGYLTRGWVTPSSTVFWLCVMQAVCSLVAVTLLTRGYQLAEASLVSVFEYSVLAFSALFGFLVWGDLLTLWSGLGLVLIAAAGSLIALRDRGDPRVVDAVGRSP